MAGAQFGVMGNDANFGLDIPETQTPGEDLSLEKKMARFSKTAEFKALKDTILQRIEYHKKYSPGSGGETAFRDMPNEERGWRSLAADLVIDELNMIINAYEMANEVVADATKAERKRRQSTEGGAVSSPSGA